MASIPFLNNLDLKLNEIQNAIAQNLVTAPDEKAGRFYYDTTKINLGIIMAQTGFISILIQMIIKN